MFSVLLRPVPRRLAISLLCGGILSFAGLSPGPLAAQGLPDGIGTVREAVLPSHMGRAEPLPEMEPGMAVFIGDRAVTGPLGRAHLMLGAATEVHLGPESELRIDRFIADVGGVIHLDGSIVFDRPEGAAGSDAGLEFHSEFGRIGVRGTRFFAGREGEGFSVFVERGSVTVAAGGSAVLLEAGQGVEIAAPGQPPGLPASWQPERIRAVFAAVLGD